MAVYKCPECGRNVSDQAKTCPHCGIDIYTCYECGGVVKYGIDTCPHCGATFSWERFEVYNIKLKVDSTPKSQSAYKLEHRDRVTEILFF